MHTLRNRVLFFGSALGTGLLSLGLHRYMMANCFDDKGLLIAGNLPGILLWVIGIGFAVGLMLMLRTIGGDGSYADSFPPCFLSGSLMIAAGAALASCVPQLGLAREGLLPTLVSWFAAGSMAVLGVYRLTGKKPPCFLSGAVCLFYILMLVNNYRLWSADPQLHEYAYQLLAGVLLMLCSFHRTSCDAGVIQRRKLLFTGLSASVCCMAALSTGFMPGFYLASGLWAAGSMCNPAQLPPDPEEEDVSPEEEDAPGEEAPVQPDSEQEPLM